MTPQDALHYYDLFREQEGPITRPTPLERKVLHDVNQKVAALPTLDDVIDYVFESTDAIFPYDRIGLAFVEEKGKRVVSRYVRADYEPVVLDRGYAEDLRGSSLENVLANGTPRIIDDLAVYLERNPRSRSTPLLLKEGVRSSLTCPLVVDGRIVGFMFRSSREPSVYTQHHVELQMSLTERLSQAVEKAWRIEQLTAANQAYLEMLGFVSHELKNPVASMVTDARLLTEGYLGDIQPQQKDKLERLIRKGEYLLELVREYLDLARVETEELKLSPVCDLDFIAEVIEPAIDIIKPQMEERGMLLDTALPYAREMLVDCDPSLLRIVLVNLLGNAVRYGREHGRIMVTVTTPHEGVIKVSVWNEGPGFDIADRPKLFRKFSRLGHEPGTKTRGTGLGLYNSWRIVQLHHGRMGADSQKGKWAEFTFEIPQPLCADESSEPRPESHDEERHTG